MTFEKFKELVDAAYKTNPDAEIYIETPEMLYEVRNVTIDEVGDLVIDFF